LLLIILFVYLINGDNKCLLIQSYI